MNVSSRIASKQLIISINGRFDFSIYPEFRKTYRDIRPQSIEKIEVDMLHVNYLDSAALGMLLLLGEHFSDKKIQISHANEMIRQVLDIANFSRKFDIR